MKQNSRQLKDFNAGLLEFLDNSPTPFHGVASMCSLLDAVGFKSLPEYAAWSLEEGGRYYVVRNSSSIIAFIKGRSPELVTGLRMVGAHTDSPCLKVKPQPERKTKNIFQVGVEVYGGALLNPWYDRDLSMAGRVVYTDSCGPLQQKLVDFKRPVAVVPSLCIHLDKEANKKRSINPQKDILPIIFLETENRPENLRALIAGELMGDATSAEEVEILDYELCLYDSQPPAMVGAYQDFIAGARLDNLLSCYVGLQALLEAEGDQTCLLVCNDHEEVGSTSACGAQGPMLKSLLERLFPDNDERNRIIARSLLISADNAHAVHPNFSDRHDDNHGPQLNDGPVIKVNANQRYATNAVTAAYFRHLCQCNDVPVQVFVNRTDLGCGSTIGPLIAAELGVPTLDVGVPTLAMHSIRELAGSTDAFNLYRVLCAFYCDNKALQDSQ